ncbi:MAG: hypothetical protein LBJ59_09565, partial [Zoogloeaceae bacterium]|nr:hypothetical protein [Zoogloeaceae bacterium]
MPILRKLKNISLEARFHLFFVVFVLSLFTVVIYTGIRQLSDTASVTAEYLGGPIAQRAAAIIDGDRFEQLSKTLDINDPFYEKMRAELTTLRKETRVLFLYTMAPHTETVHRFIIDGGDPEDEDFSPLGAEEDITKYAPAYMKTYQTGQPQFDEMDLHDTWGWVISSYVPIMNSKGEVVGVVGCDFSGESVYKRAVDYVIRQSIFIVLFIALGFVLYRYLLRALTRQNRQLLEANQRAQAAARAKNDFLARTSHEIRTPMNA